MMATATRVADDEEGEGGLAMATATRVMSERRRLGWRAKCFGNGGKGNHDGNKEGNGMEEGDGDGDKEGNGVEEGNSEGGKSDGNGDEGGERRRWRGRQGAS